MIKEVKELFCKSLEEEPFGIGYKITIKKKELFDFLVKVQKISEEEKLKWERFSNNENLYSIEKTYNTTNKELCYKEILKDILDIYKRYKDFIKREYQEVEGAENKEDNIIDSFNLDIMKEGSEKGKLVSFLNERKYHVNSESISYVLFKDGDNLKEKIKMKREDILLMIETFKMNEWGHYDEVIYNAFVAEDKAFNSPKSIKTALSRFKNQKKN